jgi:hypothetical protein
VVFWGQDGETRVRCEISREALDDHFHSENKDKLEVFRSNRRAIEEEARRKYLAGLTECEAPSQPPILKGSAIDVLAKGI